VAIHVALNHITSYRYDRLVRLSPQLVRLRPAPHCRTPILSYSLRVTPSDHFINWQQDPQSNYLARLVFPQQVSELRVEVDLVAELAVYNPFDFFLEPHVERFPFEYEEWQLAELQPFLRKESASPRFAEYFRAADPTMRGPRRTIDFLVALNQQLQRDIRYVIRLDPGVQTKEETLTLGSGSCRDSTWLLVQLLRHFGFAARFVSGYLIQLAPDVKSLDGPAGAEHDFTDLHAWCEVYLPGAGWIGLDPTSGLLAGEGHIPLSCTPDPTSAAPISGDVDECEVQFAHDMSVQRIYESPRVTKPYTEDQWARIVALGHAVDTDLARDDVRLTMGGEPTFVSADDRDGDEWNMTAVGPTKRLLAADLLWRLKAKYGAGGLVHFGQGKWYPGEQLPRWGLACYWRTDGEPVWQNGGLIANERHGYGYGPAEAERFIRLLSERLAVGDAYVQAGYEDVWYYLWRERRLPVNVDPFDSRLDDELERERLRRVFTQKLDRAIGYALPLARSLAGDQWESGPWFLRDERMYLVPGDSPMGYRLPLDSLPWADTLDRVHIEGLDPTAPRVPLPTASSLGRRPEPQWQIAGRPDLVRTDAAGSPVGERTPPARGESARGFASTALCTETRNGVLYVFLPPITLLEHYLDLVAAVEATAAELGMPVLLEGYPPPHDHRLRSVVITPDPGVIEVNIPPAADWGAVVEQTTTLYEEAHQSRLSTEKFMLDGRHTGTGGGNHFVLGGPTPADSPFLRRPDLLRSLLAYWHNHPALSYLFSGLFLGPTSQAPRVDEARHDSVYELEIAFRRLHDLSEPVPLWLVDRAFRHLLVDVSGNTHRAEFCIDKLFDPNSSSGRRGLLEMRAFEMPPHAQMSVAQQLLLRALVARFWRQPYEASLVRWGTELHDRFMLPYFVAQDFDDVLTELNASGYGFSRDWFAPHLEFRFPRAGEVATHGVQLTLRQALEPWHVLGEEGAVGGAVRFVDSSVERLQVLATGLTPSRYQISCNGHALPLQPTGRNGEYVAGVRYRAWQPPSALHPTIPVHSPLTFDIVDTWMERSLGGCQYHVMHPGGRNYEQFPVNSYEAESRRLARFFKIGHTPGRLTVAPPERSLEFPYTLDLRARPESVS
jgi:uncharacterized protein (DUF2126 family)/transglutaminase-like putative cysteine protease